jgi:hypothetical protein
MYYIYSNESVLNINSNTQTKFKNIMNKINNGVKRKTVNK